MAHHRRAEPRDYSLVPGQLEERAVGVLRQAQEQASRIRETHVLLQQTVVEFLRTGVAFISFELADSLEAYANANAATYMRAVAKERCRLPLIAEQAPMVKSGWRSRRVGGVIRLTIPTQNRLKPLVSGLLLASREADTEYAAATGDVPIARCDSAGTWRIFFCGSEGREAFDQFVESCHTNSVLRVVLKL